MCELENSLAICDDGINYLLLDVWKYCTPSIALNADLIY